MSDILIVMFLSSLRPMTKSSLEHLCKKSAVQLARAELPTYTGVGQDHVATFYSVSVSLARVLPVGYVNPLTPMWSGYIYKASCARPG